MNTKTILRPLLAGFACVLSLSAFSQKLTAVRGRVTDARTGEGLPNATVRFDSLGKGVMADLEGNFYLTSKTAVSTVRASYVGYKTRIFPIKNGETTELSIALDEATNELAGVEITAKAKRYRNRDNPAVELMRRAIERKDLNRKEHFDYYSYEKYEKVEFALNNITDKMRRSVLFKKTQFMFENADTNTNTGKVNLPFYLREALSDIYYRQSPSEQKEYIRAERSTTLPGYVDDEGISNHIQNLYREVDFYKNAVNLVTCDFVSPLATLAPGIYQFYILDTVMIGQDSCAHLSFKPRQANDLAFEGEIWITLDSSTAMRKIEARIPPTINLNWVNALQVEQAYDWTMTAAGRRGLVLTRDEIVMDYGISRRDEAKTILARKTTSREHWSLDVPLPDSLFRNQARVIKLPGANTLGEVFWEENRHDTLEKRERGVYLMVDSLNHHRGFRRFMGTVKMLADGYVSPGGVDIGPINTFSSFNPIEGYRPRFGGRTNHKISKRWMLDGYAAYGTKDLRWKGQAQVRYSLSRDPVNRYPLHQVRLWYKDDIQVPGADISNGLLLSFRRGQNNRMVYSSTMGAEYIREYKTGFSYAFSFKNTDFTPAGILNFDYLLPDGGEAVQSRVHTTEAGVMLRYAPNEQFYQAPDARLQMLNKYPILTLWYTAGLKSPTLGEYSYHSVQLRVRKAFYLSPVGWSVAFAEAGRTFGQVPYPLLNVHRANQTYSYITEAYNLMNFMEFVSDRHAAVNVSHYFGGFFFNRVPLLRKLKLREVVTCKALWGGLDTQNTPSASNGLLLLPTDDALGRPITYALGRQPYVEASVGIMNLFKFLRVDYVRRFTYLDHPGVARGGVRAKIQVEF